MNQHLQTILNFIQESKHLTDEEKTALIKTAKDANKEIEITSFKLDRTEKVKRTTAILLEETIEELEQKRKAVEAQNKELEIEAALERVRAIAMSMNNADDMLAVCKTISNQLELLNVKEIRNIQTAIFYSEKGTYMNYEYYTKHDKTIITETSYTNSEMHLAFAEQMLKGNGEVFTSHINGDEVKDWIAYQKTTNVFIDDFLYDASSLNYYWFSLGPVALGISTYQPLKEENKILFKRFLKVFELAYRRYIDIEKAEAQAKEARIETALERVRSRTMGMQKSEELKEVIQVVYDQFVHLNINTEHTGFVMDYKTTENRNIWVASKYGLPSYFTIPYFDSVYYNSFNKAKEKGWDFFATNLSFEEKNIFYEELFKHISGIPENDIKFYFSCPGLAISTVLLDNVGLYIENFSGTPYSDEDNKTLMRFGKVFQQTYTRFLDLQKAEAQAREAQIQLALERARAQSMMMQHSTELDNTLRVFHEQVLQLNIPSAFSFLWLPDEDKDRHIFWAAWAENLPAGQAGNSTIFKSKAINYTLDRNEPATAQCLIDWKSNEPVVSYHVSPDGVANYFAAWSELIAGVEQLKPDYFSDGLYYVEAFMKYGCFGVMVKTELNEDEKKILERFAIEFERAYTRFLDLQKAEAQSREAQIETSLERIRARTMGMQKSNELQEIVALLYEECNRFEFRSLLINIKTRNEQDDGFNWWMSFNERNVLPQPYFIPDMDEPVLEKIKSLWHSERPYGQIHMSGNIKAEHDRRLFSETGLSELPDNLKEMMLSYKSIFLSIANMKNGFIEVADKDFISEDQANILQRYAKVFEQAYTRFLDLQKAEAQSRESQIELALERVRAKTMAMHNSADVGATAAVMVEELKKLDIETIRCGIGIMHEPGDMEVWTISTDENNKTDIIIGWLDMNLHPLLHGAFESWGNKIETYSYELKDDDLLNYYNAINSYPGYPIQYDTSNLPKQIHHNEFHFTEGTLFAFSLQQLTDEQRKILKRFAGVFGQTYRRYLDLKRAEAQIREAQIEAALERVRSRTLAMQKSAELAETSAELFKQLIALGISPNRLYISIMKDDVGNSEFWITDEDGSKVSMAYEDNLNNNSSFKKMYEGWKQQKKSLVIDMKGKALKEYLNHLTSIHVPFKGGLTQKRRLQYIAYFSKGFIGMAAPDEQPAETLQLLERFAYVFNLTFTRFNDLQIAEAHAVQAEHDLIEIKAARKRAEETLVELQSTQKQLVQSEKMASLGELTAGIAHEIQNPLNFVNNFSEVSKELLDEMKAALESGDKREVEEIANDVIQNLEKINHHGKRADAIVKGMMQHSRSGTGVKEPTDINALCDEYLRLSYHGLRAKDKNLNAVPIPIAIKTDFDESIGKINIVPQDMGRVLLNLFNNAFYAVNEKKNASTGSAGHLYEPKVTVSTKAVKSPSWDLGVLTVSDNGNGIPQNIVDKIFQPFFTTKPTGQGTGLGLSLSYDIIKAHGGEIKVETKEGEGSEFIISLPV